MGTTAPGVAPLSSARYLLGPREWSLVERFEKRAAVCDRMSERAQGTGHELASKILANEAKTWRQAAQIVREELTHVDLDLRDPTVFSLLDGKVKP